jgi:hypothetical protein
VIKKARECGERQVLNAVIAAFRDTDNFPEVSRDMANNWRREAQKRGYLPPPTRRDRSEPEERGLAGG